MNIRKLLLTALLFVPALAFAATPAVESERTSEASGGGTSHTVTLPATISADSLILVCSSTTANHTTTWPGGWTEIIDTANGTQQSATCGYKQAVGTEDSTTISLTTSGSTRTVHKSWSITGWDTGTAPEVQSANSSGNSVTSDPPSITPSGGSDDYLYLTFSTIRIADKNVSAYPSGHTNTGEFDGSVTAGQNSIGWSRKATTASSSENPSAYTWSGSDENIALTLAVTPAAPLGPTLALSDATPDIDTSVTATLSSAFGAGGNPTTATLSSGDTVSCSSATSTTCDFPLNYSALVASGDLGATQVQTALTVTITNGTETSQSTAINIQIPASNYAIVDLTCTAGVDCTADSEAISPMVAGDDCAIKVTSGALSSLSTHCAPVFSSPAFAYTVARFDESATAWLSQEEVTVTAPVSCRKAVSSAVHSAVQSAAQEAACLLNVSRP